MSPLLLTIASVIATAAVAWWAQGLFRTKTARDQPRIRTGRRGERVVRVHESPASSKPTRKVEVELLPEEQGVRVQARSHFLANVDTGDGTFDRDVSVVGADARVLSVLTSETRRRLRDRVLNAGLLVCGDRLFLESGDPSIQDATLIDEAVALAERLDDCDGERELSRRLATLVRNDPVDGFRARCLDVLARDFPTSKVAVSRMPELRDDPSPAVRLVAFRWGLAHGEDESRAATLGNALRPDRSPAEFVEALDALRPGGDVIHLDAAVRLAAYPETTVVAAALRALRRFDAPFPEAQLVLHLATDDARLRDLVIRELGEHATVAAVEPLLPLTSRLTLDPGLAGAARDAIRRIQSRLGDVEHGRISLAAVDDTTGALSVAPDDGALSLARPDPASRKRTHD